jgi:hypothetical protein
MNSKKKILFFLLIGAGIWCLLAFVIMPPAIQFFLSHNVGPFNHSKPPSYYLSKWSRFSLKLSFLIFLIIVSFFLFAPAQINFRIIFNNYKLNRWIVAVWILIVATAFTGTGYVLETLSMSVLLLIFVLFFANLESLQTLFKAVSPGKRVFMVTVLILLLFAQISRRWDYTYPFVHFAMFTERASSKELVYYEYEGEYCDDGSTPINPTEVFPALRQRRIERKLRGLANTTFSTTEKEVKREAAKKNLQQTLISVGNLYNKKNKNQHVCGIRMYKRSFNIDSFKNDSSIKKSLVFQVVIPK